MASPLILPSSMTRESRGAVIRDGHAHEAVYCANCGRLGAESIRDPGNFVFWVCPSCHVKCGPIVAEGITPLAVFREKVAAETTHSDGTPFTPLEILDALVDVNTPLSKLAREAPGA